MLIPFTEHGSSSQCSQEPTTSLCPEPDESNLHPPTLSTVYSYSSVPPGDLQMVGFQTAAQPPLTPSWYKLKDNVNPKIIT
jgi:hypothetical protein